MLLNGFLDLCLAVVCCRNGTNTRHLGHKFPIPNGLCIGFPLLYILTVFHVFGYSTSRLIN